MTRRSVNQVEVRSVARALDLLELMQRRAPGGIRVREAAAHLGIDPATASRLLSTMIAKGFASKAPSRLFMLGTRSLRLATDWVDRLIAVAGPTMARVADASGETVYLVQLVGCEAVAVAKLTGGRSSAFSVEIGPTYPLWATAAGRALLGRLPNTLRPLLLPAEPYPAFTPGTKTRWSELAAALEEGRRHGIYAEYGEIDAQVSCYAMPLLNQSRDEKLALAISFDARRPESDRQLIRQAIRREWHGLGESL